MNERIIELPWPHYEFPYGAAAAAKHNIGNPFIGRVDVVVELHPPIKTKQSLRKILKPIFRLLVDADVLLNESQMDRITVSRYPSGDHAGLVVVRVWEERTK